MVQNTILSAMAWVAAIGGSFAEERRERGQGITEYAILLGAIALVAGATFYAFDFGFDDLANGIEDCISLDQINC